MTHATLRGRVYFPYSTLTPQQLSKAERELTIKLWDDEEEEYRKVHTFSRGTRGIFTPRQYGLALAHTLGISVLDKTSEGVELSPEVKRNEITLREEQVEFVDQMVRAAAAHRDAFCTAATGKGKTVCSLEASRRLGRSTLVVVDMERLVTQWRDRIETFLGIPQNQIGLIQGSVLDYEGRDYTIAMLQTLYLRRYDPEVYNYFGTVIFDEAHTAGAERYSKVLSMFPARQRIGITATPRKDALKKVLENNLGAVRVSLKDKHKKSSVRVVTYSGVLSWYANISPKNGRYINELAEDMDRNWMIAGIVKRLYEAKHHILVIGDRIEHLQVLQELSASLGIPRTDTGLITGYRPIWKFIKDPTPARRPAGWVKGAEYTPVKVGVSRKKVPVKENEQIQESTQILFATYGMFSKGIDVPRLSAGIDVTPRSASEQVHGRILRKNHPGKLTPVWVTIRDWMSYKAEHQFLKRLKDYTGINNAEVYRWQPQLRKLKKLNLRELEESVKKRIRKLERCEIRTLPGGINTIITPTIGRKSKPETGGAIAGATRKRTGRNKPAGY